QVPGGADHAANLRRIAQHHGVANATQPKATHRCAVLRDLAVHALHQRDLDRLFFGHLGRPHEPVAALGRISSTRLPRLAAISSGDWMLMSAFIVARTTLIGLREPWLFASTLRTPAHSSTARMLPPAIRPVPSAAGCMETRVAP